MKTNASVNVTGFTKSSYILLLPSCPALDDALFFLNLYESNKQHLKSKPVYDILTPS